jgi:hypothetical protein
VQAKTTVKILIRTRCLAGPAGERSDDRACEPIPERVAGPIAEVDQKRLVSPDKKRPRFDVR